MRIANTHLSYCLNIYPGHDLESALSHIRRQCPQVKAAVAPRQPFGLGLWLPAKAAEELQDSPG